MRHEHFDEYKARIKTGVKPMKGLQDEAVEFYDSGFVVPRNVTDGLKVRYEKLKKCWVEGK